ncbi:hypothetical protein M407DRAFT_25374 [Tulasnella calospora MUT 4182]|uniref:Uncharacterized protein n=1 Tax=Tulasnella calospora MUT 4182 TaxID=1051891 RepID=A0A0C3Q6Z2_9AGAM|nr:hypothetical protein M407DRAFT_25374 [Tulasnella calospora MUT 4182]
METIRTAIASLGLQYDFEVGALAILGDDTTNTAAKIINYTIPNAVANCAQGATSDGTLTQTIKYWYYGTSSHAEMASSVLTATGS